VAAPGTSRDEAEIAAIKAELRSRGWYVRYAEWPSGHQVVIHLRAETAVHRVTRWHDSELDAWREALSLALGGPAEREQTQRPSPEGAAP
jgi:hypothetical protein